MQARSDQTELLRDVDLRGALCERFGSIHRLAIASPAQALRALSFQPRAFRQAIAGGSWRIVRGDVATGLELGEAELTFRLGRAPLHIVPVAAGAGGRGGGIGKIVGGLALAAGAFFLGPGSIAGLSGLGI